MKVINAENVCIEGGEYSLGRGTFVDAPERICHSNYASENSLPN